MEYLAKYGDPSTFEMPIPMLRDNMNANMSFAGMATHARLNLIYPKEIQKASATSIYERTKQDFNIKQILDLSASIQFAGFHHIGRKLNFVLQYCADEKIPITGINLVGGVSCNQELRDMIVRIGKKHGEEDGLPVHYAPPSLCTDNAAMIAWMAWELLNAG